MYGKDVFDTWHHLQRWGDAQELSEGSRDIRIDRSRFGAVATAIHRVDIVWPFEVSVSGGAGGEAAIEPGLMIARVPVIRSADGSRLPLDGIDPDSGAVLPFPRLPIAGPGADNESFVAIRVRVDRRTGAMRRDDPDAVSIAYLTARPPRTADGGVAVAADTDASGLAAPEFDAAVGYDVIAILSWFPGGSGIRRVSQVIHGNRKFSFKKGTAERPDRFFFQLA